MVRLPKANNCPGIKLERCGLLFLGTPHSGSGSADWNKFLVALAVTVADVRQDTIDLLKSFNSTSVWDKKDFEDLDSQPPVKCFAEGRKTIVKGTEQYVSLSPLEGCQQPFSLSTDCDTKLCDIGHQTTSRNVDGFRP
jgi:hypothetical protein